MKVLERKIDSPIWKVHPIPNTHSVLVETRLPDSLICNYTIVDLQHQSHSVMLQEHSWWTGVLQATPQGILLHGYNPQIPSQKQGIGLYDPIAGAKSWYKLYQYYTAIDDQYFICSQETQENIYWIRVGLDGTEEIMNTPPKKEKSINDAIWIDSNHSVFVRINNFLNQHLGIIAVEPIQYAELDSYILLGVISMNHENEKTAHLIVAENKQILYHRQIYEQLHGHVGKLYFLQHRTLTCVIQDQTLLQLQF